LLLFWFYLAQTKSTISKAEIFFFLAYMQSIFFVKNLSNGIYGFTKINPKVGLWIFVIFEDKY